MSDIWKYFDKHSVEEGKCKIWKKILKRTGGSTKGLWKHLEQLHSKEFKELKLKSNENECEKNQQVHKS